MTPSVTRKHRLFPSTSLNTTRELLIVIILCPVVVVYPVGTRTFQVKHVFIGGKTTDLARSSTTEPEVRRFDFVGMQQRQQVPRNRKQDVYLMTDSDDEEGIANGHLSEKHINK